MLLQLDEAPQDIFSTLRRADDKKFVAKRLTSSSAMRERNIEQSRQTIRIYLHRQQLAAATDSGATQSQQAVDKLLAVYIDETAIPS